MERTGKGLIGAVVGAAAMLALAGPASATELQTTAGAPYTGPVGVQLSEPATFTVDGIDISCSFSVPLGQVDNAGSAGAPATGTFTQIDWDPNSGEACNTSNMAVLQHQDFVAQQLPWGLRFDWLSDNTSRARNGIATVFGAAIRFDLFLPPPTNTELSCTYVGDSADTGGATNQVEIDFFNPDNTDSGKTELVLQNEPLQLAGGDPGCADLGDATLSARYVPLGDASLQLRNPLPPAAPLDPRCANLRSKLKRAKKLDQDKRKRKLRRKLRRLGCPR